MSDMKLIMESWRGYSKQTLNEAQVQTLSDLLNTIKAIITVKKGEKLTGALLSVATAAVGGVANLRMILGEDPKRLISALSLYMGLASDAVNLVTSASDARQVVAKAAKLPDSKRSRAGYLSMLDFDDQYLQILDDDLENDLLNYMLDQVEAAEKNNVSIDDFDVNRIFEKFIESEFQRKIAGAPEKKAGELEKRGKVATAIQRVKQASPI